MLYWHEKSVTELHRLTFSPSAWTDVQHHAHSKICLHVRQFDPTRYGGLVDDTLGGRTLVNRRAYGIASPGIVAHSLRNKPFDAPHDRTMASAAAISSRVIAG